MRITTNDGDTVQALRKAFEGHEPIDFMGKKFIATNQQVHLEGGDDSPTVTQCLHVVKQVTWNGPEDGLPPVGLEVEIRLRATPCSSWCRAKVLFCKDNALVFEWVSEGTAYPTTLDQVEVRPIRTAEQLAAEAREKWAEELFDRLYPGFGWKNCVTAIQDRYRAEYDFRVQP